MSPNGLESNGTKNGSSKGGKKRQRVSLACDCCRRKKIRCNGVKPTCNNCTAHSLECTYTPPERTQKPKKR